MIQSLLIANRGEIACRIIRTARAMGIRTIAVYSDADAKALHVREADEAVHIGPSTAAQSYLLGEKIIAAARQTGAEAIHPGYGFLSENADFAQAVQEAGIIWVGPNPDSIRAMGLKDAAKELMQAAGVPVTPGYLGADQSIDRLEKEAELIGYPVLIKAVAGGGGKGMRKVDTAQQFSESLESCKREAKASFGNDRVLLEKWINSPRHIEVQIFGDSHGNIVHLFERDCSLQRRHQKVIEEAPAPGMDTATREDLCNAAIRAAKAVNYVGAGTVEFIADASQGLQADRIWFMEMNTRLQVEHPVTEQITGVDLAEWQLRVASGEELPLKQDEIAIGAHAIEARLYAEDPEKGFLPSTGCLDHMVIPNSHGVPARLELAVEQGDHVSPFYDPMIAKIITSAPTRAEAIESLHQICSNIEIYPVKTNAGFLSRLLASPEFADGQITTGFIGANQDDLTDLTGLRQDIKQDAAASILAHEIGRPPKIDAPAREPSFRDGSNGTHSMQIGRQIYGLRINQEKRLSVAAAIDGGPIEILDQASDWPERQVSNIKLADGIVVFSKGEAFRVKQRVDASTQAAASDGAILAPMPGKVIALGVEQGDLVKAGQQLLVMEAMKMEHALTAPFDGKVAQLSASIGAQVQVDALLVQIEPVEDETPST